MRNNCTLLYTGEQDCIHFLTDLTCAGDEIGWDFVSMVKNSRTSFTGFCEEMTRKYRTNNILSASFMSVPTFIKWIFSWMASMKIDFRKEVDPWCGHEPKVLACDGTHIGVSMRYMDLQNPVTISDDTTNTITSTHRR